MTLHKQQVENIHASYTEPQVHDVLNNNATAQLMHNAYNKLSGSRHLRPIANNISAHK